MEPTVQARLERALLTLDGEEIRTEDLAIDSTVTLSGSPKSGALPGREWEIQPLNVVIANHCAAAVEAADGNVHIGAPSV